METANKNVYIEYDFLDGKGGRKTGVASGKKFDPKFGEEHKFELTVGEPMLRYLQSSAICFKVFGEVTCACHFNRGPIPNVCSISAPKVHMRHPILHVLEGG